MLVYVVLILVALLLIGALIRVVTRPDRMSRMTDEEYEEEAKKRSWVGASLMGLEAALRKREANLVIEQKYNVKREAAPPGGEPPEAKPDRANRENKKSSN